MISRCGHESDFLSRYLVLSEISCERKKSNQKQEQNLLSKVFNLFWNLWNHWTRICIRLSTLCINFRLLKVYIWDRHQKYAELNTIQWIVHWLIQVLESFFLYLFNLLWQDRSLHPYHNLSHLWPSYWCWPHSSAYHYCQVRKISASTALV